MKFKIGDRVKHTNGVPGIWTVIEHKPQLPLNSVWMTCDGIDGPKWNTEENLELAYRHLNMNTINEFLELEDEV